MGFTHADDFVVNRHQHPMAVRMMSIDIHIPWPPLPPLASRGWCCLQTSTSHGRHLTHGPYADDVVVYRHPYSMTAIVPMAFTRMMLLSTDIHVHGRHLLHGPARVMLLSTDIHTPWPPPHPWPWYGWCCCLHTCTSRGHHLTHGHHMGDVVV